MRSPSTTGIDLPAVTPLACQATAVSVMSPEPAPRKAVRDPIEVLSRFSSACVIQTSSPMTSGEEFTPRRESLTFHRALPVRGWKFQVLPSLDPNTSAAWPSSTASAGVL